VIKFVVQLDHPVAQMELVRLMMAGNAVLQEEPVGQGLNAVTLAVSPPIQFVALDTIARPVAAVAEMLVIPQIRFVVLVTVTTGFVLQGGFVVGMDGVLKIMEYVAMEVDPVRLVIIVSSMKGRLFAVQKAVAP